MREKRLFILASGRKDLSKKIDKHRILLSLLSNKFRNFASDSHQGKLLIMSFEKEINEYERLRARYQTAVIDRMEGDEYRTFNEVLFSTHSCAIEGNTFSIDDTRELKEKGLSMIPAGKTLYEAFEMLDHFKAYEYVLDNIGNTLDESFLKEVNRLVTLHTLAYRSPDATSGEYTTTDMAAGDTVFGGHEQLVARVPQLLESTERAIASASVHPVILAARFHGFYEYLHPFRDGNGRTGRLISNYILLRLNHPMLIIPSDCRQEYIAALRMIRTEATDEHLIRFFFKMAMQRMSSEIEQKERNTRGFRTFVF